jgi:hypothetical protein
VKFTKAYFYKKSLENRVGSRLLGGFTEGVMEALKLFIFNANIKNGRLKIILFKIGK